MNRAPITCFVYNRPENTRQLLTSLANNVNSSEHAVHIFCDGPKPDASEEVLRQIAEVREIISQDWPFKEVNLHVSDKNRGLAQSVQYGINHVLETNEATIILEDDLDLSPHFLSFMQHELELHKDDRTIAGISGFAYPSKGEMPPHYLLPIGCSWGWAVYKRSWLLLQTDAAVLLEKVAPRREEFDFGNYAFFQILKGQVENKVSSWAILFYASIFLAGCRFVFPGKSLVRNQGFNADGTHCVEGDGYFELVNYGEGITLQDTPAQWDEEVVNSVRNSFNEQFTSPRQSTLFRLKQKIKRLLANA